MHSNIRTYEYLKEGESWSGAFRKAIMDLEETGGGTLYVPSGDYLCGPIELKSNMTLYLENGAQLLFEDDPAKYGMIMLSYIGKPLPMFHPLIYAKNAEHISIEGRGTLNGQGKRWWELKPSLRAKGLRRPHMICLENCRNVTIEGISLINSPAWTIHPLRCDDVLIHNVHIKNPADSPNTDGIDPNSSRNVRISGCIIDVGDDCIAVKSGTEESEERRPCENIVITNCNMVHGHGGIVIGSEMSGSVQNVTVENCVFQETDRGIRLKTRRKRGGKMERLSFQNIIMDRVICPFVINMYYNCGEKGNEKHVWDKSLYEVNEGTPRIRDVQISNVMVYGASAAAAFFYGLPESKIEDIRLLHCSVYLDKDKEKGMPAMMAQMEPVKQKGIYLRNVSEVRFYDMKVADYEGNLIDADGTADYKWTEGDTSC